MCRQGCFSMKHREDVTGKVEMVTMRYGESNGDGYGLAYLNSGAMEMRKGTNLADFWFNNKERINTNLVMFHLRLATSGGTGEEQSHPFKGDKKDVYLTHNGILWNYDLAVKDLESKGHKFKTTVDSEVLLHAYEEFGKGMFKYLNEKGVRGSAAIIITDLTEKRNGVVVPRILLHTNDGSLVFAKYEEGLYCFSDDQILNGTKAFKDNVLYTVCNGELVSDENVNGLNRYVVSYPKRFDEHSWDYTNKSPPYNEKLVTPLFYNSMSELPDKEYDELLKLYNYNEIWQILMYVRVKTIRRCIKNNKLKTLRMIVEQELRRNVKKDEVDRIVDDVLGNLSLEDRRKLEFFNSFDKRLIDAPDEKDTSEEYDEGELDSKTEL